MQIECGKAKNKINPGIRVSRRWFRMLEPGTAVGKQFRGPTAMRVTALEPYDRYKVTMDEHTRLQYQSEFLDFWILLKKCEREITQ